MSHPTRLDRGASWAFVLLMAVLPWSIAGMGIATALCVALTLAAWIARRESGWPRTPVEWPTLAWMLALVLATAFALDPGASATRLHKALFPALVGLAAAHAGSARAGRRAVAVLMASAGIAALVGLGLWLARGAAYPVRARGPSGHYMTFAGQLLLFVSLAAGIAITSRGRWRWGAMAVSLAGAAALAATFTRSAWMGLVVSLAVLFGARRPRWLVALAAAVALLLWLGPVALRERALSAFDPHHPSNVERTYIWQAGLRMFRDHPVTGVGLQDLRTLYDRYRSPAAHERAGHLHSVPIHLAATTGVLGLAAFAWLYASLFRAAGRGLRAQMRAPGDGVAVGVRLGVIAALAGFLLAGLFEWNAGDEELLYPLYSLVGIAWAARGWLGAPAEPTPRAGSGAVRSP